MNALIIILVCLLMCCLIAAGDCVDVERARDSRAWGAVVLAAILLDEAADRVRTWRSSRKAVRLINRYESARTPW